MGHMEYHKCRTLALLTWQLWSEDGLLLKLWSEEEVREGSLGMSKASLKISRIRFWILTRVLST
jgi:hypothetical protein